MTSPFRRFFWVVKCSAQDVEALSSASVAVERGIFFFPTYKYTSFREIVASSVVIPVYSPGQSNKKNEMQIMSAIDISELIDISAS